jgi:hypothetical protein
MATARLQVTDLDFDTIKNNLKDFLRQQSEFTDYDFEGAGLNVLLDILAYNTHYNAYYLNMVANESFLDTATTRDAVVSHAKTLNYVPRSVTAPKATINVSVETATTVDGSATIPRGFVFYSELVDNKSYNYVTVEDVTVSKTGTTYEFENIDIYEGQYAIFTQTYIAASNPKSVFTIPNPNIDIKTLKVSVVPVAIVSSTIFVVAVVGSGVVDVVAINHQIAAHLRTHQLILHLLLVLAMLMTTAIKQRQKYHRLQLGSLPYNFKF